MDTLKSLQIFHQIVRDGSFTQAARNLDISVATASKHLQHLEKQVQAKLLNRSSRSLSLTEAGQDYLARSMQALDELENAARAARQETLHPQGELRMTLPIWLATARFAQLLAAYSEKYPRVHFRLQLDNQHTDLIADAYDLALRVSSSPSPSLIVRPLVQLRFDWVASPAYLERHGTPRNSLELSNHRAMVPSYIAMETPMQVLASSNNTLMLYELALSGMGIAFLPNWLTGNALRSSMLQRISCLAGTELALHAAYVNRDFLSAKVRSMIDFLVQAMRD